MMMRHPSKKSLFVAALLLSIGSSAISETSVTIALPEIATNYCPAEWARFETLNPNPWAELGPAEIDPNIDIGTTEAYNKYAVAVIALADYFGSFVGFSDPDNQNESYFTQARSKYDLAICLTPSNADRELIVELARTTTQVSDAEIRLSLFKGFDQFDCMQIALASEAIFDEGIQNQFSSFDFEAITSAHMKVCD